MPRAIVVQVDNDLALTVDANLQKTRPGFTHRV